MSFCDRCHATLDTAVLACAECGTARPPSGWAWDGRLGRVVVGGQYRVIRRLGAGGFGAVYLVETVVGGLQRALKILRSEWLADVRIRERFINEALVLEEINHPNVARCFAAGAYDDDGEPALYLLLELVRGCSIASLLSDRDHARRPIEPLRAVRLSKQVAAGLVAAHKRGALHRDLKPENILVADPGTAHEQVKIVDFGIARAIETGATTAVVGTPAYLAPEQLQGADLDARVDLWQLGVTMFVMLTGELPYEVNDRTLELRTGGGTNAHGGPLPSERRPALARFGALDRLVSSLLAGDPARRPPSAIHVTEELARIEQSLLPGAASPGSTGLIEALCADPGEGAWRALCRYLMTLGGDELERLVPVAGLLLDHWPDHLRRAPLAWWEAVSRGGSHPCWPLVRAIDLSSRGLSDDDVREYCGNRALAGITWWSLADNELSNAAAAALADARGLSRLQWLDLSRNRITSAGVEAIAAAGGCAGLVSLSLAGNGLGARGAVALAGGRLALKFLDLSENGIQAAGAAALAASETLGALETLKLCDNGLGSDGVGALACSRTLTQLRHLDVARNGIGPGGAAALALSPNGAMVRHLGLAGNALGARGVELLLASNRFGSLESLDLSSNQLGTEGAMVLASSPFARRLKCLNVSDNDLGDAGLAAMLGATHLSGLRTLTLARNGLTPAGCTLLGGAPPELEDLDLSGNALGPAGAAALTASVARLRIRRLCVNRTAIGAAGLARLLGSAALRLDALEASGSDIEPSEIERLPPVDHPAGVQHLDLSGNGLGPGGIMAAVRWPALRTLRHLDLGSNGVSDAGAETLVYALESLPALETLGLADNGLAGRSAAALARSPLSSRLNVLDLRWNLLGDQGAAALAGGAGWPVLHTLELERNDLSLAGAALLRSSAGLSMLYRLNVARNALAGQVDVHSLAKRTAELLQGSFAQIARSAADFAEKFYAQLFIRYPSVKPLFARTPMRGQQQHLMSMLALVIDNLEHPDAAASHLAALGERHAGYGVSPSQYHAVASTLMETLRAFFADGWTSEMDDAWTDGLEAIAGAMLAQHRQQPQLTRHRSLAAHAHP